MNLEPSGYINLEMLNIITEELRDLEREYREHKALLLTEDDLQNHLFNRIRNRFPDNVHTMDRGITGCAIHSEVKFYDQNGQLTLIPDLCIIPPGELSIYHSVMYGTTPKKGPKYKRLPSKNFEFSGDALVIELKFCRKKGGINAKDILTYKNDLEKIKHLQQIRSTRTQGRNRILGILAVFNKTDTGSTRFENFVRENPTDGTIKLFYGSGLVDFSQFDPYLFPDYRTI